MRPLVIYSYIYYNIFQFFLQKRYSEADFVMKVAKKIPLYNLVFHQLLLIQYCSIFYKKKCLSEYQQFQENSMAKYPQNASPTIQNFKIFRGRTSVPPPTREGVSRGETPLSASHPLDPAALGSCLWQSTLPLLYKLRLLLQFFLRTLIQKWSGFNSFQWVKCDMDKMVSKCKI